MAVLHLIAEPFPDFEASLHAAATRDLTQALADTAPRGCSIRFFVARDTTAEEFSSPRVSVEALPMRASSLPVLWQSSATARPLDGEMTHAVTPMIPLRTRTEDDGTQSTVCVPNALAFQAPELLHPAHARLARAFVKRAAKQADVITTGTHAHAALLQEHFNFAIPMQVIQPSAPHELLAGSDAAQRRTRLGLPERYLVTTAAADDFGRLQWIFDAYLADPSLPDLVIIAGLDPEKFVKGSAARRDSKRETPGGASATLTAAIPGTLADRVHVVPSTDLSDAGAALSGAALLLQPQSFSPTGYTIIAALISGVPVLHAGDAAVAELALDAGLAETTREGFIGTLSRLFGGGGGDSDAPVVVAGSEVGGNADDYAASARSTSAASTSAASTSATSAAVVVPATLAAADSPSDLEILTVHAGDRGRTFSWHGAAWQLWETHAGI